MSAVTLPIIFPKEVAQNRPPNFPARTSSQPEIVSDQIFGDGGLDEFSIFARPPPRGVLAHAGTRGIPSDGRCRAGPLNLTGLGRLGRAGNACVVGVVERAGNALYSTRVYVELGRRLTHAHATRPLISFEAARHLQRLTLGL